MWLRKVILDSGGLDFPAVSLSLIKYGFVLVLNLLNLNYEVREVITNPKLTVLIIFPSNSTKRLPFSGIPVSDDKSKKI